MTRGSNTPKCSCKAYPYPHRLGGGKCPGDNPLARNAEGTAAPVESSTVQALAKEAEKKL